MCPRAHGQGAAGPGPAPRGPVREVRAFARCAARPFVGGRHSGRGQEDEGRAEDAGFSVGAGFQSREAPPVATAPPPVGPVRR